MTMDGNGTTFDIGARCWFTVYRCYVTVARRYTSGNYWVTWSSFGCIARPDELEPLMACGHPRSAVRGEGATHWCGMCEGEE
jgi:hypothetical protein